MRGLCALALEARERWLEWERALGDELLGDEGLVVVGGEEQAAAMREVGAPVESLTQAEIEARLPPLRAGHPWTHGIWDPLAGATRVEAHAGGARRAGHGAATRAWSRSTSIEADAIVVCAGLDTQRLIAPLGLDLRPRRSSRTCA